MRQSTFMLIVSWFSLVLLTIGVIILAPELGWLSVILGLSSAGCLTMMFITAMRVRKNERILMEQVKAARRRVEERE